MKQSTLVLAILNTSVLVSVDINVDSQDPDAMYQALNVIIPFAEKVNMQPVGLHPPGEEDEALEGRTFKTVSSEADGFKFTVHAENVGIGGHELHQIGERLYRLFMPDDHPMPKFTVKRVLKSPSEHGIHPL